MNLIEILAIWNIAGSLVLAFVIIKFSINHAEYRSILRPDVIYKAYKVNYFGCMMITLLINLICPVISIGYWICNFIYFIFTVGRKD